jgi:predicted kinase
MSNHGIHALSSDALRALLFDDESNQSNPRVVFSVLRTLLKRRLELRRPVTYVDATNLSRWERRPYVALAGLWGAKVEVLWFDEDFERCRARNLQRARQVPEEAMRRMRDRFQPPSLEEGFSRITIIREGRIWRVLPDSLDGQPDTQGQ